MKLDWWPNPVTTEGRITIEFNIGDTLDQVLGRVVSLDNHEIAVFVNGAPVLRESWNVVVLEPNDIISARVIMTDGDGGSNPIAVVLSIALLVAAPFLAARILGTTAALVQGTISGAALTAGIGFVGLLVINALFPPRLPDVKQAGQLPRQYSISGGANRARPYEPIQLLLGSHRLFPDLAAKEYTEYDEEGDQFLFQLFDFGIGKLDVGTLKIGDTDLSDYASVMTNTSADQSLVYGDVDTVVGGEFDAENLVAISRTLGAMTTQIGFDIVSQYFKVSGSDIDGLTTIFKLEYKLVTDTAWTSQNVSIDTPDGSEGRVPKRGTYTYEVDSGNYDVRASVMSSINTEDTYTFQAAVHFKGYQDTTANWKGRNPLAVKIKATGQLYGRVGTLNAECKQLIDHWNGSSWVANSETSNPGDILYKYLRGWYDSDSRLIAGMGLSTNRIDEESIKLFVTFCNNNGLECNVVIEDGRDHAETLRLICQCGWAAIDLQSGKWGVLYEDFGRALSAVVNPDNVIAGSMTVVYENEALADEIIGDFIDSASDYEQNQIRRTVPNKVNPKRPTVIPLEGIVKGEHAAKELNRAVAAQAYHIRSITWEMDLAEGMPIARGDVVGISHGLIGSGKGGRFTNIDSTRLKVTPSRTYSDSDAGSIWIWDLNDNVFSGTFTVNASGELVLSAALPNPPANLYDNPTAYRFMTFLTASSLEKVRIIGKEPASSTKLRFIARDEVDDYYNYRTSDLTWTPVTRRLLGNPSSPITAFSVSQDQNGVRIFAWALHHSRLIDRYQIRYGASSDDFDDMAPLHDGFLVFSPFESFNFPSAGSYRFGLVGLSEDGIRTSPVYRDFTFDNVEIVGLDGEDGDGIEYIFARTANPSIAANKRPSNTWGYDAGGTASGLLWTDGGQNLTTAFPYLWRSQRDIEGAPEDDSDVTDTWTSPVIVGRFGTDGLAGIEGSDGTDGVPGEDGVGYEYVFTATAGIDIPLNQRPLNTWGYDEPVSVNGLTWYDAAPNVTSSLQYLWRSQRVVIGTPSAGDAVASQWTQPTIQSRYSAPGSRGPRGTAGVDGLAGIEGADGDDGTPGDDGVGYEFIFSSTDTANSPSSPLNNWGYDSPASPWHDAAPTLTSNLQYLWRSQRIVIGTPSAGDAVAGQWTSAVIVGRFGSDGTDGTDGIGQDGDDGEGVEYIFTAWTTASFPTSRRPSNAWGFDNPGTSGGQVWNDGAPNLSSSSPYLYRSERAVPGSPVVGTSVVDSWSIPVIVGRFGVDGIDGIGLDGDDGQGIEYIFTARPAASLPISRRPSNSWGFDSGGTRDGQVWTDGAPTLDSSNTYLYRSERAVPGSPVVGTSVVDSWSIPVIVGRFGVDGIDGIGLDGDDGQGIEYIFTARPAASLPISRRPSNSWGFDSGGTRDGQVWTDGAPTLDSSNTYLYRSERAVPGSPAAGTAVVDLWSIPTIVGRFGIDGIPGDDGDDGQGVEYIFTAYDSDSLPQSRRPSNTWGYDSPGTNGTQQWHDGAPIIDSTTPFLYRSERAVPGSPVVGTAVTDSWSIPVIVGRFATDGVKGDPGDPASRGSGWFRELVTQSEQSQLGTLTVSLNAKWITRANALTPGENITNDIVTFWRGESFSSSWYWNGTSWLRMLKFIGAETILAIDINAITGSFDDLDVSGVLAADKISADVRNWIGLWKGNIGIDSSVWATFNIPSIADFYSIVVEVSYTTAGISSVIFNEDLKFSASETSIQGGFYAFSDNANLNDYLKFQRLSSTSVRIMNNTGAVNIKGIWGIKNPATAVASENMAPSWTDNTGTSRSWTQNSAISSFTVPAALGTPTPTYSISGLPTGLSFNTSSRLISGTPISIDSGTITVTATNLEGTASWTMPYSTAVAALQVPGTPSTPTRTSRTSSSLTLATVAGSGGAATRYRWRYSTNSDVTNADPEVTSNGPSVTIPSLNANDNYWIDVRAENSAGNSAYSGDLATATLAAPVMNVAPNWSDDTGNSRSWTRGTAISGITVPAATGTPTPTYSASGLPTGVSFDTGTRGISGTPTGIGSGTITITATNSEGTAAWTMPYSTSEAALTAPGVPSAPTLSSRTDTSLTLATSAGSGGEPTLYRWRISTNNIVSDNDPMHTSTGPSITITGLNAEDEYWIDVHAENSAGESAYSADLATSTLETPIQNVAPSFADDTGDAQSWTEDSAISGITVPAASGTPTPTYSASGLPSGLNFNTSSRQITGTPTGTGSGTITITATNSEGTAAWTMPYSTSEAALTAPGVPSAPTLSSRTDTSLTLATSAGSGGEPTLYRWRISTNNIVSDNDPMHTSTGPSITITGLNAEDEYWIDVHAENSAGESAYSADLATSTLETPIQNVAPSFADDTGDAQSWTEDSAISGITVPAASGTPTPTYSASGLPSGLNFNTSSRQITGTPTGTGSGTITITATNSEGTAAWTMPYSTAAALQVPGTPSTPTRTSRTSSSLTLATVAGSGGAATLYRWRYSTNSTVSDTDPMVTSTGPSVTIPSLNANDNYWIDVRAENSAGNSAYSGNLATATLAAPVMNVAPSWADNTGTDQSWTQNSAISGITVPAATGTPTPTYSASGLPTGVSFDTGTRGISGTPTGIGSGTITITATNSEGTAAWTMPYSTAAAIVIPAPTGLAASSTQLSATDTTDTYFVTFQYDDNSSFTSPSTVYDTAESTIHARSWSPPSDLTYIRARFTTLISDGGTRGAWSDTITYGTASSAPNWTDDTGTAQSWTVDSAISGITVPAASGTPTPTYSASGLPSGLNFNTSSRQISGTPTGTGSGTITITATNSEGTAAWTMPYSTAAALQAPGIPSTPTRTSRTSSSLTLATVAGSGGAATLYRWRYSTNSTVSDTDPMVTSNGPSVTIPSLNANDNYWIDVRAENSAGNSAYSGNLATATLAAPVMNVAPSWADDTGDAQSWTQDSAISGITVPAASGTPTPTYSASGLPLGLSFNAGTLFISGTPTLISSGTITITATNSEGMDTWTVAYGTTLGVELPGTPSTPTLTSRTSTTLTLATVAGSGGTPSGYEWQYSTNATISSSDPSVTSTTRNVTISGLEPGTNYWIDVIAQSQAGDSDDSGDLATSTLEESTGSEIVFLSVNIILSEAGAFARWRIKLSSEPASDVVITATESDPDIILDAVVSRTYTSVNWDTYQDFYIGPVQDIDSDDDTAIVTFTASGGSTDEAMGTVTIVDDD